MPGSGLEEFREVISDVRSITSWAVGGAVAAPLADLVLHIGAPWPPGVPLITSLVELASLICVFHFWVGLAQRRLTTRILVALVAVLISSLAYLYLFDTYTFVNPATSKRYAKGFVVRPDIEAMLHRELSSPEEALAGLEYREEEVWTAGSITAARLTLLATWLLAFGSLSTFLGTFVIAQRRRRVRRRA
jgi:hypothetical protein